MSDYENVAMNSKTAQDLAYRSQLQAGATQGVFSGPPPSPANSLADRLSQLVQLAHTSGAVLGSARERLCGGWPENANQANGLRASSGAIDSILDELQAALVRIAEHSQAINNRI